jgi:hypothetical protein
MNLNPDKVPINLEEALTLLKEALTPLETKAVKKMLSTQLHFSFGMHLRNEWSLWDTKNILNTWFKKVYGVDHADDISGIILECLINDLNGLPRRDKILAKQFINHWKEKK